jgi:hypothetical protein
MIDVPTEVGTQGAYINRLDERMRRLEGRDPPPVAGRSMLSALRSEPEVLLGPIRTGPPAADPWDDMAPPRPDPRYPNSLYYGPHARTVPEMEQQGREEIVSGWSLMTPRGPAR